MLKADTLVFDYAGKRALDRVSLQVSSGQVFALLGANGGGKSTLLRLLAGLVPVQSGSIKVGEGPNGKQFSARDIGYMPQGPSLAPHLTILENLELRAGLYGLADGPSQIRRMIDRLGLGAYADTRSAALSGGWRRRAELACVLLHQPPVLLLDEPTTGLDAVAKMDIWREISQQAQRGVAVLVATHDHAEAERADSALFLLGGHARAAGTPGAVAASAPGAVCIASSIPDDFDFDTSAMRSGLLGARREGQGARLYLNDTSALGEDWAQGLDCVETHKTLADAAFLFAVLSGDAP